MGYKGNWFLTVRQSLVPDRGTLFCEAFKRAGKLLGKSARPGLGIGKGKGWCMPGFASTRGRKAAELQGQQCLLRNAESCRNCRLCVC